MKTLMSVCMMNLVVTAVVLAEVVQSIIAAWPYLVIFALVFGVLRARVRRSTPDRRARNGPPRPAAPLRPEAPPVTGWVLAPVWMGPRRAPMPVIDAEVIDERREPT